MRLPAPRESDAFRDGVPSSAPFPGKETVLRGVFGRFESASLLMERSQSSVSAGLSDSWDMLNSICSEDMKSIRATRATESSFGPRAELESPLQSTKGRRE